MKNLLTIRTEYGIIKTQGKTTNQTNQKKEVSFMEKKITKKEMFNALAVLVNSVEEADPNAVFNEEISLSMMRDFVEHEIELLENKSNSRKNSAKNSENERVKENILRVMAEIGKPVRLSELIAKEPALGSQNKVNAMLTQLKNDGVVIRTLDKKAAYFSIA